MEIHTPEGPTKSLREFAIHIGIVTIGILIALALEGAREVVHDRHLVRETREAFHDELETDAGNAAEERKAVARANALLDSLVKDLPQLRSQPDVARKRVGDIQNSFYFFGDSSWQAALSTGSLAHMQPQVVTVYAQAFQGIHEYVGVQRQALPAEFAFRTFAQSHTQLTDAEWATLTERALLLQEYEHTLSHVGEEMRVVLDKAAAQ